jgi:hypothetical protein
MTDRLAISFWIEALWDTGTNGFFTDLELRMTELVERGFNCIRVEGGAGWPSGQGFHKALDFVKALGCTIFHLTPRCMRAILCTDDPSGQGEGFLPNSRSVVITHEYYAHCAAGT